MEEKRRRHFSLGSESRKNIIALNIASYLTIIIAFGFMCVVSFWMLYPYEPIVINSITIDQTKPIRAGEDFVYTIDYIKNTDKSCLIALQLTNGFSRIYTPFISNQPPGHKIVKISKEIPSRIDSGEYRLKWSGTYQMNPIRTITITTWSEPFYIEGNCLIEDGT